MVRNYKPKGTRKKYSKETLDKAVQLKNEGKSLRAVSSELNMDKMYLQRYLKKINNPNHKAPGHEPALTNDVEEKLANHLCIMAKNGFALSKEEVLDVVKEYVEQNSLVVPFTGNRPGHDWYKGFCKRQKMSLKKMEPLEKARKINTSDPFLIYNFYDLVEQNIKDLSLEDKPNHIYNLDETSFCSDPSRIKLLSGVGQKAHRTQEGTGRDNTTVLACCNADGLVTPPLIIFQGANLWSTWKGEKDLPGTFYACSQNGWMTSEIFHDYFKQFCKTVKERPLLLIFDGHMTHLDVSTAEYARDNQITIIKLPAHTSDFLQPLDKACFKTLKYVWDQQLLLWYRQNQRKMLKDEFVDLLCKIWHTGLTIKNVKAGFESSGIFPFDRTKYPIDRLDPEKLARYKQQKENHFKDAEVRDKLDMTNRSTPSTESTRIALETETQVSSEPSTSSAILESPLNVNDVSTSSTFPSGSFEELLLEKMKRTLPPARKRKRVDAASKVITSEDWINAEKIAKEEALEKEKKKIQKAKKTNVKAGIKKGGKPKNKKDIPSVTLLNDDRNLIKKEKQSSDESDVDLDIGEDSDDSLNDYLSEIKQEAIEPVEYITPIFQENIKKDTFIIVDVKGGSRKSTHFQFVCQIDRVDEDDGELIVQGLRSANDELTEFIFKENDRFAIDFSDVRAVLPFPMAVYKNRGIRYLFPGQVNVKEF